MAMSAFVVLAAGVAWFKKKAPPLHPSPPPPNIDVLSVLVAMLLVLLIALIFRRGGSAAAPTTASSTALPTATKAVRSLADRAFTSGKLPSTVWAELQADIARGARERGVQLRVCHTYHLNPPNTILDKYKKAIGKMKKPNEQQLYHGTRSFDAVLSIADGGFRLPPKTKSNMFGPGVYFATVPQKSYDYTGSGGWILICNVAVGKSLKVKKATFIDPDKDLRARSWIFWTKTYESVLAPAGNSTVSDEYVVYVVDKICPVYLISVERV